MFIGGLDIGTSGCKITVYDDKGNFIENHYNIIVSKKMQKEVVLWSLQVKLRKKR